MKISFGKKFLNRRENLVVYVFIDASNLWQAQKAKGRMFDYGKLRLFLKEKFGAVEIEIFYYTAYPADGTRSYSLDRKHKFFTYLKKGLGFKVRKKELKRIVTSHELIAKVQEKGNMDVELTIDAVAHINKYDIAILFTGDSDFLALITHIMKSGKEAYVFSSKNNVSKELKTGSNGYFDVLSLDEDIWGKNLELS